MRIVPILLKLNKIKCLVFYLLIIYYPTFVKLNLCNVYFK